MPTIGVSTPRCSVTHYYVPSEVIRIQPGEVLYLRWTFHPPAKGSSALMAIDDVRVRFQVNPPNLTILFR